MTPCALVNGTGIIVYSLCNECISTILIRDGKYISNFCAKCDKHTFAIKFPGHTEKYMSSFYELEKQTEEQKNATPEVGRTWKDLVPCTVSGRGAIVTAVLAHCCKPTVKVEAGKLTYNFCFDCQKRTGWAKYPKPFKNAS
ncbi:unnamed protein product [Caenorhabditis nigoni]|nr:hypothetical protein B9Z55_000726 [Caenorhabditis nigoni]